MKAMVVPLLLPKLSIIWDFTVDLTAQLCLKQTVHGVSDESIVNLFKTFLKSNRDKGKLLTL